MLYDRIGVLWYHRDKLQRGLVSPLNSLHLLFSQIPKRKDVLLSKLRYNSIGLISFHLKLL